MVTKEQKSKLFDLLFRNDPSHSVALDADDFLDGTDSFTVFAGESGEQKQKFRQAVKKLLEKDPEAKIFAEVNFPVEKNRIDSDNLIVCSVLSPEEAAACFAGTAPVPGAEKICARYADTVWHVKKSGSAAVLRNGLSVDEQKRLCLLWW